jgi:thiol-disulfide isomerase/thioredoxin
MRKLNQIVLWALCCMLMSFSSLAQTITDFELTNALDAKVVSLKSLGSKPVVVIFFSNKCPFDKSYIDRIKLLEEEYQNKVSMVLINSSIEDDEKPGDMNVFAKANTLTIPYLADKEQKAAAQFNPRKTPEAFLLQPSAGKFNIVYRGSIDDNPQSASEVGKYYLKDAIDALLAGKKIEVKDVRPVGCSIKRN